MESWCSWRVDWVIDWPEFGRKFRVSSPPVGVVIAFGISVLGHGLTLGIFWLLAQGLQIEIGFTAIALIVPLGLVASIVPIAIAGIGPREAALVGLFGLLGVARESALALSLTFAAVLIALAAVGGLLQLGWGLGLETASSGDPVEGAKVADEDDASSG